MLVTVTLRYSGLVLQFAILALLARRLSPDDYGKYMLVLSAVLPTYFAMGFGVSEAFVREAPHLSPQADPGGRLGRLVGATCAVAVGTAAAIAVVGAGLVWLLPLAHDTKVIAAFGLAFFIANGLMFNGAQILLGLGSETAGAFFFYPAINLSLVLTVVPYLMLAASPTFAGTALTTSAAALLMSSIALAAVVRRTRPRAPRSGDAWHLASLGFRLSLARALYGAGIWLPTFIAGIVLNPIQAGSLGTAGRVAIAVGAVMAAFRFSVRPAIVRASAGQDPAEIKNICGGLATVSLVLACLALAFSALAGSRVLSIAFGPTYAGAAPLLTILLVAVLIEAYAGPVDEVLKMTGHEKRVLAIFCVAVPISAACLVAAAHSGLIAMAWVQVLYTFGVFGSMILIVRREFGVWLRPAAPQFLANRIRRHHLARLEV